MKVVAVGHQCKKLFFGCFIHSKNYENLYQDLIHNTHNMEFVDGNKI